MLGRLQERISAWRLRRRMPEVWPEDPSEGSVGAAGARRVRVLLEYPASSTPWIAANALEGAGYETMVCEGPGEVAGACRAITHGECALVRDADVVYNGFGVADEGHRSIIEAVRRVYPDTPVVVEVTRPSAERHPDLLDGCTLSAPPIAAKALTDSVATALEGRQEVSRSAAP